MTTPNEASPLAFDNAVAPGGYRWWYLDAISDDGAQALTLIAFIGSVFSPYYARARRLHGAAANPCDHCAINLGLYGHRQRHQWAMTERGSRQLTQQVDTLRIGPSGLHWDGHTLTAMVDEIAVPWPARLRGRIELTPSALMHTPYPLDPAGRHHWQPIAPNARVTVAFDQPGLCWEGTGYLDTNWGSRALEDDFVEWHWSRAALQSGQTAVFYDVTPRTGSQPPLALKFDASGQARHFKPPPAFSLPASAWHIGRATRSDDGNHTALLKTLEDGPFYARSMVQARVLGQPVTAIHESLSLNRFKTPWVQALLPFKMPRRA